MDFVADELKKSNSKLANIHDLNEKFQAIKHALQQPKNVFQAFIHFKPGQKYILRGEKNDEFLGYTVWILRKKTTPYIFFRTVRRSKTS